MKIRLICHVGDSSRFKKTNITCPCVLKSIKTCHIICYRALFHSVCATIVCAYHLLRLVRMRPRTDYCLNETWHYNNDNSRVQSVTVLSNQSPDTSTWLLVSVHTVMKFQLFCPLIFHKSVVDIHLISFSWSQKKKLCHIKQRNICCCG